MSIYFIRAGDAGPVKIGWAKDVEARRAQLQVSHAEPLVVIRTIEGTRKTERWLHDRYDAGRQVGEWFQFDADMLDIEPPDLGPVRMNWRQKRKAAEAAKARIKTVSWAASMCTPRNPCTQCLGLLPEGMVPILRLLAE